MLYWDEQWSPHPVGCSCFRTCPCLSRRHHRLRCMSHQEVTMDVSTRMHGSWSRHGRVSLTSFASFQPCCCSWSWTVEQYGCPMPSKPSHITCSWDPWLKTNAGELHISACSGEKRMVGEKQAGDLEPKCRRWEYQRPGHTLAQVASYVCGLPIYMHRIGSFLPSLISATSVIK